MFMVSSWVRFVSCFIFVRYKSVFQCFLACSTITDTFKPWPLFSIPYKALPPELPMGLLAELPVLLAEAPHHHMSKAELAYLPAAATHTSAVVPARPCVSLHVMRPAYPCMH